MLDGAMRRIYTPLIDAAGSRLAAIGVKPDAVTLLGAGAAVACGLSIAGGFYGLALACLVLSRLCDGLDGAVARNSRLSDVGGLLDIICDFVFYAAVPLGFALHDANTALAAAVLLASFYLNAASFLGFAILAAKRGMTTEVRGPKSLYVTTGLAEGTETIAVFVAMLIWPTAFSMLACGFAALCLVTCLARVRLACVVFRGEPGKEP